jgi:hypothetical protein
MRHDELDRILSGEEDILPSSGFRDSVMDAVRNEAATPPPIPFPWARAVPGLAAFGLALLTVVAAAVDRFGPGRPHVAVAFPPLSAEVGWASVALLLSFACLALCRRLAGATGN